MDPNMTLNMEIVVPLLSFATVVSLGGAMLVAQAHRRRCIRSRLVDGAEAELDRDGAGGPRPAAALGVLTHLLSSSRPSGTLKAQLARAGYHDPAAASVYLGAKMVLLVAGIIGGTVLMLFVESSAGMKVAGGLLLGVGLSFLPNFAVYRRRRRRCQEMHSNLPNAVDLLEICVSSGMGLDTAWNAVADEVRQVSGTLADEMALTNLEMHLGAGRTEALRHMVARTGVEELASLVAVLVQSERFGTSVAEALKTFSNCMRESRSQRAEEGAEKLAVKLLFPLTMFIFPVVFIVVAGPAGIKIAELISGN